MGRSIGKAPPNGETKRVRKKPVTWFLVADGTRAKVYVRQRAKVRIPMGARTKNPHFDERTQPELQLVPGMTWKAESPADYDFSNKTLGRVNESAIPARHMAEPRVDIREDLKLRFMRMVAEELEAAQKRKAFDRLVLIAPPKLLGELKKQMKKKLTQMVVAELPKEVTHSNSRELAKQLEEVM